MPRHDYEIEADDILVLFGAEEKVLKSEEW
jgi:hypothetical protein